MSKTESVYKREIAGVDRRGMPSYSDGKGVGLQDYRVVLIRESYDNGETWEYAAYMLAISSVNYSDASANEMTLQHGCKLSYRVASSHFVSGFPDEKDYRG